MPAICTRDTHGKIIIKRKKKLLYCVYFQRRPYIPSQGTISSPVPTARTSSLTNRGAPQAAPVPAPARKRVGYGKHFPRKGGQTAAQVAQRDRTISVRRGIRAPAGGACSDLTAPRPAASSAASAAAEPPRANCASAPALPQRGADGTSGLPAAPLSLSEAGRPRAGPSAPPRPGGWGSGRRQNRGAPTTGGPAPFVPAGRPPGTGNPYLAYPPRPAPAGQRCPRPAAGPGLPPAVPPPLRAPAAPVQPCCPRGSAR